MDKTQSIEEFYQSKFNWVPDNIHNEIGHFNVFRMDDYKGKNSKPIPYSRKDYFKITLIIGKNRVHYADKVIEIKKQAIFFTNPQIPYKFEWIDEYKSGFFCVFTPAFFHNFGNLKSYEVFQPNTNPVFELTDEQLQKVEQCFVRMLEEIRSDYPHKYDVLRNIVFEILHYALKMQPASRAEKQQANASQRISHLFIELLERQFPIEDARQRLNFRSPSDFAQQLSIHVNHLNRAVKETMKKTTSEIIAERILQETKILLRHTEWSVSEIAYSLGFTEATHFNNFFRKHTNMTPTLFRIV